jgi:uncharacterized protein YbcV (DUF1398 family)
MFTIEQIKEAHAKVKSGADFPKYIQELKALGLVSYEHYVSDGHTLYRGTAGFSIAADAKYPAMEVADTGAVERLQHALLIHQQGQTDYPTFCRQAVEAGVEKWTVNTVEMRCTYFDKAGNAMVAEEIPVV